MLKKFDSKFIRIAVLLICLPILFIIILVIIRGCSDSKTSYALYEDKMIKSAEKYLTNKNLFPKNEGGKIIVNLNELIKYDYIKNPKDSINDKNCDGDITVINNGGKYLYIPNLKCDNYKTAYLIDKLKENIVTDKSGLYQVSDGYVFKGSKVNNYLKFFDKDYRIVSIDNDGIIKLVKVSAEKDRVKWDYKFNVDVRNSYGKNDYSDSNMLEVLNNVYSKVSEKQKVHLIPYSVCYGNRSFEYLNVDKVSECSKKLDNQYVSLLNTYDFAMASYDKDCTTIGSGACRNYNYLYDFLQITWFMNGDADNTFKVYYYSMGNIISTKASSNNKYNIVIYISGYEQVKKGDGSKNNPYIIG